MVVKKRGLGRGLDALLGGATAVKQELVEAGGSVMTSTNSSESELKDIPIDLLQPGQYQPRIDMHDESLKELADSIRAQGILQPIVVRRISTAGSGKSDQYEIIAGERRWRAAQLAELHNIPAVVRDVTDEVAILIALIENIQREDLNPVEEATALQRLIDEFEMTHQQAAEAVGRSRAAVSNLLRLLSLSDEVRKLLEKGELEMGHARAILTLNEELQTRVAREIAQKCLSVREAEALVRKLRGNEPKPKAGQKRVDPNILSLQEDLSEKLGAKVVFQHGSAGKGKVVLHYNSLDELDGILAHIK